MILGETAAGQTILELPDMDDVEPGFCYPFE